MGLCLKTLGCSMIWQRELQIISDEHNAYLQSRITLLQKWGYSCRAGGGLVESSIERRLPFDHLELWRRPSFAWIGDLRTNPLLCLRDKAIIPITLNFLVHPGSINLANHNTIIIASLSQILCVINPA